jgi:ABC-type nitrate/sulfonate/bicarbonate transport system permease component
MSDRHAPGDLDEEIDVEQDRALLGARAFSAGTVTAHPESTGKRWWDAAPAWVGGLIGTGIIIVVWWIASQTLYQESQAIPSPGQVFSLLLDPQQWQTTWNNASSTVAAAVKGYAVGNLAAIALSVLVLLLPFLAEIVNQIAIVTYCIPLVAIGPILVIVAGRSSPNGASIALAALSVFFTTVVGCLLGLRAAHRTSLDLVLAYGGSKWTMLRKVQLIAALPSLFAALKIAAPAAFLGAVLAEYLGSGGDSTIGRALIAAQTQSDAPQLWYLALVSGAIAGAGYLLVGVVARIVTPWTTGADAPGATA